MLNFIRSLPNRLLALATRDCCRRREVVMALLHNPRGKYFTKYTLAKDYTIYNNIFPKYTVWGSKMISGVLRPIMLIHMLLNISCFWDF